MNNHYFSFQKPEEKKYYIYGLLFIYSNFYNIQAPKCQTTKTFMDTINKADTDKVLRQNKITHHEFP